MSSTPHAIAAFRNLFIDSGTRYEYRKGEFVIRPGEQPSGVFYIETGLVKAYDITKYGEENLLIIRKPEEFFPFIWGMTGQERNIIYEALAPSALYMIKRDDFLRHVDHNPDALSVLLDAAMEMYRLHSERILNLGYRNVRERLVSFLLTTSARFGKRTPDGYTLLDVPLRYQDIGSAISASRETVGREMQALERRDMLFVKDGFITLCNQDGLQDFL